MTNDWITTKLGHYLAQRDTLRRALARMRYELLGDDFETALPLKPKDADIVLQNYARDFQAFEATVANMVFLYDNHILLDDDQYPMSTTELNKTVSRVYGFSREDQLPREAHLAESFEELLQVYDADDSELGIHLRDQMQQAILRLRKHFNDKP